MNKISKKTLSIILTILMIVTALPLSVIPIQAVETGWDGSVRTPLQISEATYEKLGITKAEWQEFDGYYAIRDASEFCGFAKLMEDSVSTFKANAVLLRDIIVNTATLSESYVNSNKEDILVTQPIYLKGIFDGNGHYISGLYCCYTFNMGDVSTIRNLTIKNSYFDSEINGYGMAAAIAGLSISSNTYENIVVDQDVTIVADNDVGGIFAYSHDLLNNRTNTLRNCAVFATVRCRSGGKHVGALVGDPNKNVVLENCYYLEGCASNASGLVKGIGVARISGYNTEPSDKGCTILSSKTDSHTHIYATRKPVLSTCSHKGYSGYTYCMLCGEISSGQNTSTAATGSHIKLNDYIAKNDKHWKECYYSCGLIYDEGDCTTNEKRYCTGNECIVCGNIFGKTSYSHDLVLPYIYDDNATCTTSATESTYCLTEGCEYTDVRSLNKYAPHELGEYVYNGDSKCNAHGTQTAKCKHCSYTHTKDYLYFAPCVNSMNCGEARCAVCLQIYEDENGNSVYNPCRDADNDKKCDGCGIILNADGFTATGTGSRVNFYFTPEDFGIEPGAYVAKIVTDDTYKSSFKLEALEKDGTWTDYSPDVWDDDGTVYELRSDVLLYHIQTNNGSNFTFKMFPHEEHTGTVNTCLGTKCDICKYYFGESNGEHQAEGKYNRIDSNTHRVRYECCGTEVVEDHIYDEYRPYKDATCTSDALERGSCRCSRSSVYNDRPIEGTMLDHNLVDVEGRQPGCVRDGYSAHKKCKDCSYTEGYVYYPVTEHKYYYFGAKEPTCYATGSTGVQLCRNCSSVGAQSQVIPALEHEVVIDKGYPATCSIYGLTDGEHCANCTYYRVNGTRIEKLPHEIIIDEYIAPTCTSLGLEEGEHCKNCDYYIAQRDIPMLYHEYIIDEYVAPTCTSTGLTKGEHCATCDTQTVKQEVIPMLEHTLLTEDYIAPTCTEVGYAVGKYCKDCDYKEGREKLPELGHDMKSVAAASEPNCAAKGHTEVYGCTRCVYRTGGEEIAKKPHQNFERRYVETFHFNHCNDCYNTFDEQPHDFIIISYYKNEGKIYETVECSGCDIITTREAVGEVDPSEYCNHLCHKDGFMGFIAKIAIFFWKLFKMNPVCKCDIPHY